MVYTTHSQSAMRMRWMLILVLFLLAAMVLRPVIEGIIWGIVVAILLSPIQDRVLLKFPNARNSISLILLLGVYGLTGAPLIWGIGELQSEISVAYGVVLTTLNSTDFDALEQLAQIPGVGPWLSDRIASLPRDTETLLIYLKELIPVVGRGVGTLVRDFGTRIFLFVLTFIASFFFLRDGKKMLKANRSGLLAITGTGLDAYLRLMRSTVFAVSIGIFGAALAQGIVAMIGYILIGHKTPLLLGLISALASLIPIFGASLVWGPIVVGLIVEKREMVALALAAWGFFIVHPIDNVLRPLLISNLMDYPFILIFLGIVGGYLSFGLIGVFLGPAILGVARQVWSQWCASRP